MGFFMSDIQMKKCTRCRIEKELGTFHKAKRGLLGRRSSCIKCEKARKEKRQKKVITIKQCSKCRKVLSVEQFYKNQNSPDNFMAACKECINRRCKEYLRKNRKKRNAYERKYYNRNNEKILKNAAKIRKNNSEKYNKRSRDYYQKHIEKKREAQRLYRKKYPDRIQVTEKKRWEKNKNNPKLVVHRRISDGIHRALKKGSHGRSWRTMVPYNADQLIRRLKKTIPDGYTWEDFLNGDLHLDHKIPVSAFDFEKPEDIDFQRCWSLKNLQLLPALENMKKGDRFEGTFQTSFAL